MKTTALCALVLAASAAAQAKKPDPLKDFKYGQRVEIIFRSNFGVSGKLIPMTDEAPDLAKAPTILIDLSLEYPELGGSRDITTGKLLPNTMGFERVQVKSVRLLPELTRDEVAQREKLREDALAAILVAEASRRKLEADLELQRKKEIEDRLRRKKADDAKTLEGQLKQKLEQLEKARQIHEKFPPGSGWGPEKLAEITRKGRLRLPVLPDEQEFVENFELWIQYKNYLEEQAKPPVEGPKLEETKKEEPKGTP